jgi:hypothetical protein
MKNARFAESCSKRTDRPMDKSQKGRTIQPSITALPFGEEGCLAEKDFTLGTDTAQIRILKGFTEAF